VSGGACALDTDCDDGVFCNGSESCVELAGSGERVCVTSGATCVAPASCDETLRRCVSDCASAPDADGDGHASIDCGGDDCDPHDPLRFPSNPEVCDDAHRDEDCDPTTLGARDSDGDGAIDAACCNTSTSGGLACGADCDDLQAAVRPGATEACDGSDNDCDVNVDEGVIASGFADRDGDGRGDPSAPLMACAGSPSFSVHDDDCDDSDPMVHGVQLEVCDALDNDCDERVDEMTGVSTWYEDHDGDGYGSAAGSTRMSCEMPAGYALLPTDCDDDDDRTHPGAIESCDTEDSDCSASGGIDPAEDFDGDGQIAEDYDCIASRTSLQRTDCDDRNSSAFDGQTTYFAVPRADGSFDYDCDGRETRFVATGGCTRSGSTCTARPGFATSTACGATGSYIMACTASGATGCLILAAESRVQLCR
jgi:hypothetical protein